MALVRSFRGWLGKSGAGAQDQPAAQEEAIEDSSRVATDLGVQAANLGREAAEMLGQIDDVAAVSRKELAAFEALSAEIATIVSANGDIRAAVESSDVSAQAARAAVERVASDVTGALDSLHEVGKFADEITRIALQTRLVAFNAAVEAKHAGAAGLGFAVVAEAVRDLAQKVEATSKTIGKTVQELNERIGELARNIRENGSLESGRPTFYQAFRKVADSGHAISGATARSQESCNSTLDALAQLQGQAALTGQALEGARKRADAFLSAAEYLAQMAADRGASTVDSPYIEQVIAAAARVSEIFEAAVASGRISMEDLFDTDYRPISGTNPQQCMSRCVALTDEVLPPVQEAMLEFSDKVVFCAAVDVNGFLPTHNRKFSKAQGQDPVWNAANCRNRRIFNDRTGIAAARNRHRFLLQTYRRDMGGGNFKLMKDVSAPIIVRGRHWGGLRLAYGY
jgi:methyl-accepting chemotaxis protein